MTPPQQNYDRLDLLTCSESGNGLDETGFSTRQLAGAIFRLVSAYGADKLRVTEGARSAATLDTWRHDRSQEVCFRYRFSNGGTIWVGFPAPLFNMLFERFYGGDSTSHAQSGDATKAQRLFAVRLSSDLEKAIFAAWPGDKNEHVTSSYILMWNDEPALSATASMMTIVDLAVAESAARTDVISFAISPEHIAAVRSPSSDTETGSGVVDGDWKARLLARAHHIRLPVRSILAQPEISAGRLLTLQAGDFLPLAIPKSVNVNVGQQLFARGVMGESHGNCAIRLEKVVMGTHI